MKVDANPGLSGTTWLPRANPEVGRTGGFDDLLKNALSDVNQMQAHAERSIEAFATGEQPDPAVVAGAVNKADLAFRTMLQIRNRLVSAFNELRQMQI